MARMGCFEICEGAGGGGVPDLGSSEGFTRAGAGVRKGPGALSASFERDVVLGRRVKGKGSSSRFAKLRGAEPTICLRCVSSTVGVAEPGTFGRAGGGSSGAMGRGGGCGMGPSFTGPASGRLFFFGGALEVPASAGADALEDGTWGRFFCWVKYCTVASEYPRGRGSFGWSRTKAVWENRQK